MIDSQHLSIFKRFLIMNNWSELKEKYRLQDHFSSFRVIKWNCICFAIVFSIFSRFFVRNLAKNPLSRNDWCHYSFACTLLFIRKCRKNEYVMEILLEQKIVYAFILPSLTKKLRYITIQNIGLFKNLSFILNTTLVSSSQQINFCFN